MKRNHLSQQKYHLQWDGQRSTLVKYIPKWHELLESSNDRRALKVLQQLVPPTYRKMFKKSPSFEEILMELAMYCCPPKDMNDQAARNNARKRKSSERNESRNTQAESTPVKKKIKLPCYVCTGTNHSNLLGCPKFKKYLPDQSGKTRSLPEDVCRLCLRTLFRDCHHNSMKHYQDYICQTSKRNFIICSTCSKHENVHHWLRVNHEPSIGNDNIYYSCVEPSGMRTCRSMQSE